MNSQISTIEGRLFRAVKGRVYHLSDDIVRADHIQSEVVAICGARFQRWYVLQPQYQEPDCPKCRRVLSDRQRLTAEASHDH